MALQIDLQVLISLQIDLQGHYTSQNEKTKNHHPPTLPTIHSQLSIQKNKSKHHPRRFDYRHQ